MENEVISKLNELLDVSIIDREKALNELSRLQDIKLNILRQQFNELKRNKVEEQKEEKRLIRIKEREEREKEKEKEKSIKDIEKEEKQIKYKIEKEARDEERNIIIQTMEFDYKKCNTELFIRAIELDLYKLALEYYSKRILENHKIITFKDNKNICIYSDEGIYIEDGDIYLSNLIQKDLKEQATDVTVKEIINKVRRHTYFDRNDLRKQPKIYQPVKNGLLNLETGKLESFTPKYIYFTKINIDYIPGSKCPYFLRFLESSLPENELNIKVIQEWMGNLLLNDNRFQRALLLYGAKGENGKSVLLKVIGNFLGHKNFCSISLQALEKNQFALARLSTRRANIFFDLPKSALGQTSNFKLITSGDPVTGEFKGQDSFEFYPMTKMMFSCNEIPRTPDRTNAFFRRWIIVPFNETFPEGDKRRIENLDELLSDEKEMQGILQFAYEGLKRLLENNKFTENMNSLEVREFWLKKSDSVASFSMDMLEESTQGEWIEKSKLYGHYTDYCDVHGYEPLDMNIFFKALKDVMNLEDYKPSTMDTKGNTIRINALKVKLRVIRSLKDEILEEFKKEPLRNFTFREIPHLQILEQLTNEGLIVEVKPNEWRLR